MWTYSRSKVSIGPILPSNDRKKRKLNSEWEEKVFFTTVKEKCACLICGSTVATAKQHNVEKHFGTCHQSYHATTHWAAHSLHLQDTTNVI